MKCCFSLFKIIAGTVCVVMAVVGSGRTETDQEKQVEQAITAESKKLEKYIDQIRADFKHIIQAARDADSLLGRLLGYDGSFIPKDIRKKIIAADNVLIQAKKNMHYTLAVYISNNYPNLYTGGYIDKAFTNNLSRAIQAAGLVEKNFCDGKKKLLLDAVREINLELVKKFKDSRTKAQKFKDLLRTGNWYWYEALCNEITACISS